MYWNPAAERLLGWKRDEVLGQPPPCGTGPLRTRQGREFVATVFTSPVRAPSGATRGTLTIAAEESSLGETAPAKSELVMQR
jgi:hypothetical protein